jgi:hypothetical protein
MPGKMARSAPRPPFGLPEVLVAIHTSRQPCRKAGKAPIFTPIRESSGESRVNGSRTLVNAAVRLIPLTQVSLDVVYRVAGLVWSPGRTPDGQGALAFRIPEGVF